MLPPGPALRDVRYWHTLGALVLVHCKLKYKKPPPGTNCTAHAAANYAAMLLLYAAMLRLYAATVCCYAATVCCYGMQLRDGGMQLELVPGRSRGGGPRSPQSPASPCPRTPIPYLTTAHRLATP
eukprot:3576126-Rhodomonas_salina.1